MTERTYKKDLEVINLVRLSHLTFSEFVTFDFISGGGGRGADLIKQNLRLSILPLNQPYRIFMDFIKWSP